jgi:hypothetical protein
MKKPSQDRLNRRTIGAMENAITINTEGREGLVTVGV